MTKEKRKALKAIYQVHICVNTLNEFGVYDLARAKRRAKSFHFWQRNYEHYRLFD